MCVYGYTRTGAYTYAPVLYRSYPFFPFLFFLSFQPPSFSLGARTPLIFGEICGLTQSVWMRADTIGDRR